MENMSLFLLYTRDLWFIRLLHFKECASYKVDRLRNHCINQYLCPKNKYYLKNVHKTIFNYMQSDKYADMPKI